MHIPLSLLFLNTMFGVLARTCLGHKGNTLELGQDHSYTALDLLKTNTQLYMQAVTFVKYEIFKREIPTEMGFPLPLPPWHGRWE